MSNTNLLLKGSTLRVIRLCINIGIGFWMLPFLLQYLGNEDYALWVLIGSVVSSYYLMDLGISQAVTRYTAIYIHKNEPERANHIINTSLFIFSLLAVLLAIVSVLAAFFVVPELVDNIEDVKKAQAILLICGLSMSLEFPAKAFPGIISAYFRFDTLAIVRTIAVIIGALATYYFISGGYGVVTLAVIALISNICTTSFFVYYSKRLFKELSFKRQFIKKSDVSEIYHFSKWTFIIDITKIIKEKMDVWLIAAFISASAVTVFYVAVRLVGYASELINQALNITGPIFTKYYAQNEIEKLRNVFLFFVKLYILAATVFIAGLMVLGEEFIFLWVGDEVDYKLAFQCLILLAFGRLLAQIANPFYSLLLTLNKHKYPAYLSVVDSSIALASGLYLIPKYGVIGAAISFSLLVALMRITVMPIFVKKFIDIAFIPLIIRSFVFITFVISLTYMIEVNLPTISTWIQIAYYSPLIALSSVMGSFVLFNKKEKVMIINWLKKLFKKKPLI